MTADNLALPSALIKSCRDKLTSYNLGDKAFWLLVHTPDQTLNLMQRMQVSQSWPVSTSRVGLASRDGGGGTPPGLHLIRRKIGQGAAPGTVFVSRQPTGKIWTPGPTTTGSNDRDLILTRILTLEGLEEDLNRGPGVDSLERYIYLHGTNHPEQIGQPVSRGCVRLTNEDVCELFDLIKEGDPVVIV